MPVAYVTGKRLEKEIPMTAYEDVNTLAIENAAYVAGLIDGEGSISLTRHHRNEERQLVISISDNERSLLDFVLCTRR